MSKLCFFKGCHCYTCTTEKLSISLNLPLRVWKCFKGITFQERTYLQHEKNVQEKEINDRITCQKLNERLFITYFQNDFAC